MRVYVWVGVLLGVCMWVGCVDVLIEVDDVSDDSDVDVDACLSSPSPSPTSTPSLSLSSSSSGSCNIRSALSACGTALLSSNDVCRVSLPHNEEVVLDPDRGEVVMSDYQGSLFLFGNNSLIRPLSPTPSFRLFSITNSVATVFRFYGQNFSVSDFGSLELSGGAISVGNLDVFSLENVSFVNCTGFQGGAVYVDNSANVSLSSCLFTRNVADSGGAIALDTSNQGIDIVDCVFHSNYATRGGAMYLHLNNIDVDIERASFWNNTAEFGGGMMMYNGNLDVHVFDSEFDSNSALKFYGGGIYSYSSNFNTIVKGVIFTKNSAIYGGSYNSDSDNTNLQFINCTFYDNSASYGAGVTLYSSHEVTLLRNCSFINNRATLEGGGVYIVSINYGIDIINTVFYNNSAGSNGGALGFINANSNIDFVDVTFSHNTAGISGGAIYSALETSNWRVIGVTLIGNIAGTYGGGVYLGTNHRDITLEDLSVIANTATFGGGIYIGTTNTRITFDRTSAENNFASDSGGGMLMYATVVTIQYSTVCNNVAGVNYGGLGIEGSDSVLIDGVVFRNNSARKLNGGAIGIEDGGDVIISNSSFLSNIATTSGGGVYLLDTSSGSILNSSFLSNSASLYGGALFSDRVDHLVVEESEFSENYVERFGGAVVVLESIVSSVNASVFYGNLATDVNARGSALFLYGCESYITGNVFRSNSCKFGAGTVFWVRQSMSEPLGLRVSNSFDDTNTALYGRFHATEGVDLAMDVSIVEVTDYDDAINSFTVQEIDYYSQIVETDSSSTVHITVDLNAEKGCISGSGYVTGGKTETLKKGVATFDSLQAFCGPGTVLNVSAKCKSTETGEIFDHKFRFHFRECVPGEVLSTDVCAICPHLQYSFRPSDAQCRDCPENAKCPGGNVIDVDEEYWRQCQDCHDVLPCRITGACNGGTDVVSQCREGHTGPLCNVCESGYAFSADMSCTQCSSDSSILITVVLPVVIVIVIVSAVYGYRNRDRIVNSMNNFSRSLENWVEKYELNSWRTKLKILVSLCQILSSLPTMFELSYPTSFSQFLDVLSFANLDFLNIFTVGCMWKFDFYDYLLLNTLGPLVGVGVLAVVLHARMKISTRLNEHRPAYSRDNFNDDTKFLCIVVAFVVFSPSSLKIFQTFVCEDFEDGTSTLVADSNVSCYTDTWHFYVIYSAFMILIYPLGIPLFYMYSLHHDLHLINPPSALVVRQDEECIVSPEIIQDEKMKLRETYTEIRGISFLFQSYLPKTWYFEVIECFRRLLLTSVPILFLRSTILQIVLVELISLGFCALYMELRPFANKSDNLVAICSQWAVALTVFGSMCLRVDMTEEVDFGPDAVGVVLVIVNVFVGCLTCYVSVNETPEVPVINRAAATNPPQRDRPMQNRIDKFPDEDSDDDVDRTNDEITHHSEQKRSCIELSQSKNPIATVSGTAFGSTRPPAALEMHIRSSRRDV